MSDASHSSEAAPDSSHRPEDAIARVQSFEGKPDSEKPLRWWPAAIMLLAMPLVKYGPLMLEAPPFPLVMASFLGPGVLGAVLLLWWLFASRASLKEKIAGSIGVLLTGTITAFLLHHTMQGMTIVLYQIPAGMGAFAIALILLARQPGNRLPVAMIAAIIGFGVWDLFQLEGVTGNFAANFLWRWAPTAEEQYLTGRAGRGPASSGADDTGSVKPQETLEESQQKPVNRENAEWSDFRGPQRDGRRPGIQLKEDWTADPPRLIWKSRIGPGWSSFTVCGDRLFTQEQRGEKEAVICLNAQTGAELWSHEYTGRFWEAVAGAGPRATPTISDQGLICLGANGNLLCLDPMNGNVRWKRDLQTDSDRKPPQWGFSSSPLVHDGMVVVHAGGSADRGVMAYDATTGEPRWSVPSGDHSYRSPHAAAFDGVTGILMQTNDGLQFLNPADGATLWNHEWKGDNYRVTQPLVIGNSVLLATSLGIGTRRITVLRKEDRWETVEDWTTNEMKPDFNDFVEYQGHLYGFDGNIFSCLDLTNGKRLWKRGRYGNGQVLLLPDHGQLLVISETGEIILLHASPEKLIEVGKFQAITGKTWNHPVLIGNRLFVRNGEEVACYELPTAESAVKPEEPESL